jgi:hypothetical protein
MNVTSTRNQSSATAKRFEMQTVHPRIDRSRSALPQQLRNPSMLMQHLGTRL